MWKELNWEEKTSGDKIRTIIAHNDDNIINKIVQILNKREDVEIIAITSTPENTYKKIIEMKPEMVFAKYDFGTEKNGLDILRKIYTCI